MLKEHSTLAKVFVALIDTLILLVSFWLAYKWREAALLGPITYYFRLLYFSIPTTLATFVFLKVYGPIRFDSILQIIFKTFLALLIAGILSSAALYLTHSSYFSRLLFGYYFVIGSILISAEKIVLKFLQNYLRAKGYNQRDVLVIGAGQKLERLIDIIKGRPEWGLNVKSILPFSSKDLESKMRSILEEDVIDEVMVAFSRHPSPAQDIGRILGLAEEFGKIIKVFINLDEELKFSRIDFCYMGDMPALAFYSKTLDPDLMLMKRAVDIAGALIGLVITACLFPFIAIAIKMDTPGPVFFSQVRVGLNGRRFKLYKFRTMCADAEHRKKELLKANEQQGPIFKIRHDPRITGVGGFLRMSSLDELPQFWNVLKGDMSLVGTRPPTPEEVHQYKAWHYRRISIRPGITGLWQVSGRNNIKKFDDIVALDLKYISSWSMWLDCKILLKTVALLLDPETSGAR